MDPGIASIVAAIISALAAIVVAVLTTRERGGVAQLPPHVGTNTAPAPAGQPSPETANTSTQRSVGGRLLRVLAWVLIAFLYIYGAFAVTGGLWWADDLPSPMSTLLTGIFLLAVAIGLTWFLWRRA